MNLYIDLYTSSVHEAIYFKLNISAQVSLGTVVLVSEDLFVVK